MSEAPPDLQEYSDWLRLTAEAYPEDEIVFDSSKDSSELNTMHMLMLLANDVPSPTIFKQPNSLKEKQARSTATQLPHLRDSNYAVTHQLHQRSLRFDIDTQKDLITRIEPSLNSEVEALLVKGFRRVERKIERIKILTKKHGGIICLRDAVKAVDLLHKTTTWLEELGELVVKHDQQQQSSSAPQDPSIENAGYVSTSSLSYRDGDQLQSSGHEDAGGRVGETGVISPWPMDVTSITASLSRPCWSHEIRSKILTLRSLVKRVEESGYIER